MAINEKFIFYDTFRQNSILFVETSEVNVEFSD